MPLEAFSRRGGQVWGFVALQPAALRCFAADAYAPQLLVEQVDSRSFRPMSDFARPTVPSMKDVLVAQTVGQQCRLRLGRVEVSTTAAQVTLPADGP